jgi:hypothetical protein
MVMSSLMAGQALAQNEKPRPSDRPAIQPQPTPSTPEKIAPSPFEKDRNLATNAPSVLRDLEGVWRVEVRCSGEHWKMDKDRMSQPNPAPVNPSRPNEPNPTKVNNPNPSKPAPDNPADNNPNPSKATPDNSQPNNPNRVQDPFKRDTQPGTGTGEMKEYVGYAESRLILGGNVLEEKIIIPDMMTTGTGRTPGRIEGAPTTVPTSVNDEMFRGLKFLSFDPSTQRYTCVFMDSRSGQIHQHSGTYNESEKRLVFDNASFDNMRNPNDKSMTMHGDMRVVVDIISPTQHRVTMYGKDVTGTRSPTIPPTPNTPAPGVDKSTPTVSDSDIIFQATYTKASNEDAPKFRRLLAEPGAPLSMDRDLRDNKDRDNKDRENKDRDNK